MINTAIIDYNKQKQMLANIVNNIYLFPGWEVIKQFDIVENKFIFGKKLLRVNLLYKYSKKNMLEKYSVRSTEGQILAGMDLKVYKDSIFIVNIEKIKKRNVSGVCEKLLQTAIQKAICFTTKKEVYINILPEQKNKRKLYKILIKSGFKQEENQSKYEMSIVGKTYKFKADNCNYINGLR